MNKILSFHLSFIKADIQPIIHCRIVHFLCEEILTFEEYKEMCVVHQVSYAPRELYEKNVVKTEIEE